MKLSIGSDKSFSSFGVEILFLLIMILEFEFATNVLPLDMNNKNPSHLLVKKSYSSKSLFLNLLPMFCPFVLDMDNK